MVVRESAANEERQQRRPCLVALPLSSHHARLAHLSAGLETRGRQVGPVHQKL
jgi:hypothetical protein